jgi:hypothetical protein
VTPSRSAAAHGAKKVKRKAIVPFSVAQIRKLNPFCGSGVIDQYIDSSKARYCGIYQFKWPARFPQISFYYFGISPASNFQLFKLFVRPSCQSKPRTPSCQRFGNGFANAAACAGYNNYFALQIQIHAIFPFPIIEKPDSIYCLSGGIKTNCIFPWLILTATG